MGVVSSSGEWGFDGIKGGGVPWRPEQNDNEKPMGFLRLPEQIGRLDLSKKGQIKWEDSRGAQGGFQILNPIKTTSMLFSSICHI